MGNIKKQHFAPQFYLRNFSDDEKSICVYDKSINKEFKANITDVASENAFYDVPEIDNAIGKVNYIEKSMHPIENAGAEAIAKLLKALSENRFCRIHPDIKIDLSIFLAMQYLRTNKFREHMTEMFEKMTKEMFYNYLCTIEPDLNVKREDFDITLDDDKKSAFHALTLVDENQKEELAALLHKNYWHIAKNNTTLPLFTSDNPLVKYNQVKHPERSMDGFNSLGIEIMFPLSLEYLLIMHEKQAFPQAKQTENKVISITDENNIIFYNHLQVIQSYRQIFSIKPGFELAKQMIQEEPWLSDIDREKIAVHTGEYKRPSIKK